MLIDYISDPHFDTHLAFKPKLFEERFDKVFMPAFETKQSDTLIIAGDLGEFNRQNLLALRLIREQVGYKHIFFVLGNHDWLLSNRKEIDRYQNSFKRVEEMKELIANENGIHLLDGDVFTIESTFISARETKKGRVRIGGAMGWYDGAYALNNLNADQTKNWQYLNRLWQHSMIDADNIWGIKAFDDFFQNEWEKLERIHKDVDVMVSHINPSIIPEHTAKRWRGDDTTAFFTFDGTKLLMEGSMKHWIFGHTHDKAEFVHHRVKCYSNPFGYPGEHNRNFRVKTIEV